jgi:hypothetical protein
MACEAERAAIAGLQAQIDAIKKSIAEMPAPERAAAQHAAQARLNLLGSQIFSEQAALAKCLAAAAPPPPPPIKVQPQDILITTNVNPPFNTASPTWAKDLVGGKTFLSGLTGSAEFEWTQVLNTAGEFDDDFVGLSGWVISPDQSDADNPFLHPFGFDWEFFIAPDAQYQSLAAPSDNNLYVAALALAQQSGLQVQHLLGMEVDGNLVPDAWRLQDGDRVAVWGRWIVDTGHPDFHTEIHPPALLVGARSIKPASTGVSVLNAQAETFCTIIGRPFLVSQVFSDGHGLEDHLLEEVAKVKGFASLRLEAHPVIFPKPFRGVHLMSFSLRAPQNAVAVVQELSVSVNFVTRTGVVIEVAVNGTDGVTVFISMNEVQYKPPTLPQKSQESITISKLKELNPSAGSIYEDVIFASILTPGNPLAPLIEVEGILTDTYAAPLPPGHASTTFLLSSIPNPTPVLVDDNQPFPIVGTISLKWVPKPIVIARS